MKNNALKSTREVEGGLHIPIIRNLLLLLTNNSTARHSKTSFTAVTWGIIVAVILDCIRIETPPPFFGRIEWKDL